MFLMMNGAQDAVWSGCCCIATGVIMPSLAMLKRPQRVPVEAATYRGKKMPLKRTNSYQSIHPD